MHRRWTSYFRDPHSGQPLTLLVTAAEGEDVIEGWLVSEAPSRQRYAIVKGVPRFASAAIDPRHTTTPGSAATIDCYTRLWATAANRLPADSEAELFELATRFAALLGLRDRHELRDVIGDAMNCLDAGCGLAWNEYLFNVNPTANRFAIDLSLSVDIAFERTRHLPNVCVAQADLFNLPFPPDFFDVIFSAGVLHHTGDARAAFHALSRHLRPQGLFGIYVYKVKPFLRELADRELRQQTTRLSSSECAAFAAALAHLGRALQQIKEPVVIDADIPLLGVTKGTYAVHKFLYDHFLKCYYSARSGYELSVLANVDWYAPTHASHHTKAEIVSWFEENGLANVTFIDPPGWEHAGFFASGRRLLADETPSGQPQRGQSKG